MFRQKANNPALAALLILAATAFIALSTLLAKALGTGALGPALPALQISHGRFLFAWIAVVAVVAAIRPAFTPIHWRLHMGRTLFGWAGITLLFASVAFIPMAEATAISFLNPVFCMMLAIPLLGERVGPWRWLAAGIALIGAVILLRPTPGSFQPAGLIALAAALAMAMELILIKRLTGREGPLQILLINNGIGAVIATLAMWPVWLAPVPVQWMALIGVGLSMAAAQACFVNGMARAEASFVAPFSYATLVFAAIYDAVIFDVFPDITGMTGAAIILGGGILLAWREGRAARFSTRGQPAGVQEGRE